MIMVKKMPKKHKPSTEWFKQADYDLETAEVMLNNGRYIHTVFMCHLSIEKALKGLYGVILSEEPPKTHDLIYLVEKIKLGLSSLHQNFIEELNDLSIPTRYPDELERLLKHYKKTKTKQIFTYSKELLQWLKEKV